jgi:hypothetical protein
VRVGDHQGSEDGGCEAGEESALDVTEGAVEGAYGSTRVDLTL